MKELSIEQKAIRYDEAIKKVNDYYEGKTKIYSDVDETLDYLFPELKESEEERIREDIIRVFKGELNYTSKEDANKFIAWLEKQGEQKQPTKYTLEQAAYIFLDALSDTPYNNKPVTDAQVITRELLKFLSDVYSYNPNAINEQKPTDTVDPKFKAGDWIITNKNHIWYVDETPETISYLYRLINQYGKVEVAEFEVVDKKARLWTIQDAKDGDILLSPSTSEGDKECPFIFKEIDKSGIVRFHAALLQGEDIKIADGITNVIGYANAGYHTLATKEQRDTLMKAMADAGWEFDFEKKELKKIEEEFNGEDYGIDSLYHAQRILEKTLGKVDGYQSDDGILDHKCAIAAVNKLYKQKPAKWSEEDERLMVLSRKFLDDAKHIDYGEFEHKKEIEECMDWIRNLKERVQFEQKWGKKDEEMMKYFNEVLDYAFKNWSKFGGKATSALEWLELLKDRCIWKPSKEQIIALRWILNNIPYCSYKEEISGLLDQIKKLREE